MFGGIEFVNLSGSDGDDTIDASAYGGSIAVSGGSGATCSRRCRDSYLDGGEGNDSLYSGAGNGILYGSSGVDLRGVAADVFYKDPDPTVSRRRAPAIRLQRCRGGFGAIVLGRARGYYSCRLGAAMSIRTLLFGKGRIATPRRNSPRRPASQRSLTLHALEERCVPSGNVWTQRGGDAGHTGYVDVAVNGAGITDAWNQPINYASSGYWAQSGNRAVAIDDTRVYRTELDGYWASGNYHVMAYDLQTGGLLWNQVMVGNGVSARRWPTATSITGRASSFRAAPTTTSRGSTR